MKRILLILLCSLLLTRLTLAQVKISQEPRATTISTNDDVLLNATNNGTGTWTTKRGTVGALITGGMPLIQNLYSNPPVPLASATNAGVGGMSSNLFLHMAAQNRTAFLGRPPLGFQLWQSGSPGEATVLTQLTNAINMGLLSYGWQYFNLDAGWCQTSRDGNGNLITNGYWPHGVAWLANTLQAYGCKLGLYLDMTQVPGDPHSRGQVGTMITDTEHDAAYLASQGVGYIKIDGAEYNGDYVQQWYERFASMLDSVAATNQYQVVLEGSATIGADYSYAVTVNPWMPRLLNCMRFCGDAYARYGNHVGYWGFLIDELRAAGDWVGGPGHYIYMNSQAFSTVINSWWDTNDLRAVFGISAIQSQPLIVRAPSDLQAAELPIVFTNREYLDINQDPLAVQGYPISTNGDAQVWLKPLANGDWAVALWNRKTTNTLSISCGLTNIPGLGTNVAIVRDVYTRTTSLFTNAITATVNTNGLNLYRILRQAQSATFGWSGSITNGTNIYGYINGLLSRVTNVWVPPVPLTNLVAWYTADANIFANGTATNWPDNSGSGINATNSGGSQPYYTNGVLNGLPAYYFGLGKWLHTSYGVADSNITAFAVVADDPNSGQTSNDKRILDKAYSGGFCFACDNNYTNWDAYIKGSKVASLPVTNSYWAVLCFERIGNSMVIYGPSNSIASNTCSTAAFDTTELGLGAVASSGANNLMGWMAEVLYYTNSTGAALSSSARTNVMTYLRQKYNLP